MRRTFFVSVSLAILVGCGGAPPPQVQAASAAPVPATGVAAPTVSSTSAVTESGSPARGAYARADLDALERQQSWTELVDHLQDIPPGQRDEHWQGLATEAVTGRLKALRGGRDKMKLAHQADEMTQRFSSIRSAPALVDARGDILVDAIGQCATDGYWSEGCDWLTHLFEGDAKHAVAAGHAAGFGNRPVAMKLYGLALATDAAMVCADDGANKMMLQGLASQAGTDLNAEAKAMRDRCRALKK